MTTDDPLVQGRGAFARRAWADAYARLSAAGRDRRLASEDLQQLATAVYLVGNVAESADVWARAHHEFLQRGDIERAARCAFWLAFGLFHVGERARGTAWNARARRLLDDAGRDCVERGYPLLPVGLERLIAGDMAAAHRMFCDATDIASRYDDPNLLALARDSCGRVLIRMGEAQAGVRLLDEAMVAIDAGEVSSLATGAVYCSVIEGCLEVFELRRAQAVSDFRTGPVVAPATSSRCSRYDTRSRNRLAFGRVIDDAAVPAVTVSRLDRQFRHRPKRCANRANPATMPAARPFATVASAHDRLHIPMHPPSLRLPAAIAAALSLAASSHQMPLPYKDPSRPIAERVADLVGRMTVEEKVAQLQTIWTRRAKIQDEQGRFTPATAQPVLGLGIGEVARPSEIAGGARGPRVRSPREQVEFANAVQRWVIENTRLGIPVMFHEEALHGFVAPLGTHFPVPLGLGSTWDPALVERAMAVAAREARARGCQHVLSPVIDLARDPRWGRIEETFGEDPYLVSRFGVAAVRGYQGTTINPLGPDKVLATLKHYAGHGSHEGGINTAPALIPERLLRAELLVPFEAAVQAGAWSVMPSYNEIDGVPMHANSRLLEGVLRGEWGFKGPIVADYSGIAQLAQRHRTAADKADAARQAIEAGVDMELPDPDAFESLASLVNSGKVAKATLDAAVSRVLAGKFAAGLFEHPYVDADAAEAVVRTPAHRELALEAARTSLVLLKNDAGLLPFDRAKLKTLAVIGPNAKGLHLGGYSSGQPPPGVDVLTGITGTAGAGVKVVYAEGVRITEHDANWWQDAVTLADPVKNRARIREAVEAARQTDAIVVVVGTNESTSREAWADNHLGDAADISLSSQQDELIDALLTLGKPTVAVLVNGRPLAIPDVAARVPAILEAWYPGQEGGTAIGEVLFGDVNPGGKLPVSFPRSAGQLPVFYNRRPTSYRNYLDQSREPLWTFGHGLSYTTFALAKPGISPASIRPGETATVTVSVTNTGTRRGDEVVQMYIRDAVSSVTRPVKELAGFERVTLDPGQTRIVAFTLDSRALSLVDQHMKRVVEPGRFDVMVGTNSTDLATVHLDVVDR